MRDALIRELYLVDYTLPLFQREVLYAYERFITIDSPETAAAYFRASVEFRARETLQQILTRILKEDEENA